MNHQLAPSNSPAPSNSGTDSTQPTVVNTPTQLQGPPQNQENPNSVGLGNNVHRPVPLYPLAAVFGNPFYQNWFLGNYGAGPNPILDFNALAFQQMAFNQLMLTGRSGLQGPATTTIDSPGLNEIPHPSSAQTEAPASLETNNGIPHSSSQTQASVPAPAVGTNNGNAPVPSSQTQGQIRADVINNGISHPSLAQTVASVPAPAATNDGIPPPPSSVQTQAPVPAPAVGTNNGIPPLPSSVQTHIPGPDLLFTDNGIPPLPSSVQTQDPVPAPAVGTNNGIPPPPSSFQAAQLSQIRNQESSNTNDEMVPVQLPGSSGDPAPGHIPQDPLQVAGSPPLSPIPESLAGLAGPTDPNHPLVKLHQKHQKHHEKLADFHTKQAQFHANQVRGYMGLPPAPIVEVKRRGYRHPPGNIRAMEDEAKENPYPSRKKMGEIATSLNLDTTQVVNWFTSYRKKNGFSRSYKIKGEPLEF